MSIVRSLVLISSDPRSMELGAQDIYNVMMGELAQKGLSEEVAVRMVGDVGRHDALPLVIVYPEAIIYGPVKTGDVCRIVEEHLYKGRIVGDLQAPVAELSGRIAWLSSRKGTLPAEQRIVLANAGLIDPDNIEDYIVKDGYAALGKVLSEMNPEDVVQEIVKSGLQGRGGAGFPTGLKWRFVAQTSSDQKYVVCNADESEPGTFKDRLILEGDPHCILEAMAIAGYAVGATQGYVYIRGEYKLVRERLQKAIHQAENMGLLGGGIFGTDFDFHVHLHSGAGAYICGEETSLLESLEGRRGEPRRRPPYPTTYGLYGKPTVVNNVETLANIPPIIRNGAEWFRGFGTPRSPGTKVYTMLGNVNITGLIEVPMGTTLREIITIYAGGMKNGRSFKMAQTGGSSGSIIPSTLQDTPMDFESLTKAGVSLGSGALLVCDEDTCVVDLARVLMDFFRRESCGKCVPCRVGTKRAYMLLTRIAEGLGDSDDVAELDQIANTLWESSNCGLGQTAHVPIRDVLNHFRAEVDAHVKLKVCPTGSCPMSGRVPEAAVA